MRADAVRTDFSLLTDHDVYLFREGTHARLYEKMGAHLVTHQGVQGTHFAVWAPNAGSVSVVGDFNNWNPTSHPLAVRWDGSGIWEGFISGLGRGTLYKYHIVHRDNGYTVDKGDPFAFCWEVPPRTGSVVWDLAYDWQDRAWMQARGQSHTAEASMSLYEVHLGSWRRDPSNPQRLLGYREIAQPLVDYLRHMGFTHVEFLPVMEHPFYASWGYQTVGYFAPTRRYGDAQDLMALIDLLHQNGFGVILDWVPSHFPSDQHGLSYFDGTNLYEHADPRLGFHPDWKSLIFNYGRHEVRSFLTSSAMFWLDAYHADGLRVDAVASMLYLDYSRQPGEWIPNEKGGRENLQAIHFLRGLNGQIHADYPDVHMIAEESTAWPKVTGPAGKDGLGFDLKWNMGWMHDTLTYMGKDPLYRKHQHDRLTFSIWYAFTERYVLPLSHDEVVHGKGSLYERMPGDAWQKRAALRLLVGYQFTQPGKKLLFMGGEFGQHREWDHDRSLDWHLLEDLGHHGLQAWTRDLCHLYRSEPALHELDCAAEGFEWVDFHDADRSVISFLRWDRARRSPLVIVCNFTPVPRPNYRVGVPHGGPWREVVNSDARDYGGSAQGNLGEVEASPASFHGRFDHSLSIVLPPLAMVVFKGETGSTDDASGSDLPA